MLHVLVINLNLERQNADWVKDESSLNKTS